MKTGNYKAAGVDIQAGDAAVDLMASHVRSTHTPQVLSSSHGGFGGMFQLDYPPGLLRRNYKNPVLVASTDGVGTKLEVAYRTGIADTIGIDLVAMCVNDIIVQGAEPLFFLDYIAVGKLEPWLVAEVVKEDNVFPMIPAGASVSEMLVEAPRHKLEKPEGST